MTKIEGFFVFIYCFNILPAEYLVTRAPPALLRAPAPQHRQQHCSEPSAVLQSPLTPLLQHFYPPVKHKHSISTAISEGSMHILGQDSHSVLAELHFQPVLSRTVSTAPTLFSCPNHPLFESSSLSQRSTDITRHPQNNTNLKKLLARNILILEQESEGFCLADESNLHKKQDRSKTGKRSEQECIYELK